MENDNNDDKRVHVRKRNIYKIWTNSNSKEEELDDIEAENINKIRTINFRKIKENS